MYGSNRLSKLFNNTSPQKLTNHDKYIIFSDEHKGTNDWADDFAHNSTLYFHVLEKYYYPREFKYIGLGDTCELLETHKFEKIRKAHSHIFWLMKEKFYNENRFSLILGNHDIVWKFKNNVENMLYKYWDDREKADKCLFKEIVVPEAIVFHHEETDKKIFLIHGHQVSLFNYHFWWVGWLLLPIWKGIFQKFMGWKDPTSPAQIPLLRVAVEHRLENWVKENKHILIAGHTHRPMFPTSDADVSYINAGSCIHPRCITGVEIANGKISLIKWWYSVDENMRSYVKRELVEDDPPTEKDISAL